MRLIGLVSVFDQPVLSGKIRLIPVICSIKGVLAGLQLDYLILDLHESANNSRSIRAILCGHSGIRLLVIGPQVNDDLAMEVISAGDQSLS